MYKFVDSKSGLTCGGYFLRAGRGTGSWKGGGGEGTSVAWPPCPPSSGGRGGGGGGGGGGGDEAFQT